MLKSIPEARVSLENDYQFTQLGFTLPLGI